MTPADQLSTPPAEKPGLRRRIGSLSGPPPSMAMGEAWQVRRHWGLEIDSAGPNKLHDSGLGKRFGHKFRSELRRRAESAAALKVGVSSPRGQTNANAVAGASVAKPQNSHWTPRKRELMIAV
jgi:hypothetical protein